MKINDKNIDSGKVMALSVAGWKNDKIAAELGITSKAVEEVLRNHAKKLVQKQELEETKEPKQEKIVHFSYAELCEIYKNAAAIGAKEALKAFKQEQQKELNSRRDRRIGNTKLLLRNYHMLKEHAQRSVFGRTQMEESALDILESMMYMYDDKIIIDSIKRSATRTAIIVAHIETMFELYAIYCDKSQSRDIDMRRYEVVWDMYMAEDILTAKEIAEKQHISKDTVYSDLRIAIERLTALIFGVDGLNVQ